MPGGVIANLDQDPKVTPTLRLFITDALAESIAVLLDDLLVQRALCLGLRAWVLGSSSTRPKRCKIAIFMLETTLDYVHILSSTNKTNTAGR